MFKRGFKSVIPADFIRTFNQSELQSRPFEDFQELGRIPSFLRGLLK
jgi:hypothetical protein